MLLRIFKRENSFWNVNFRPRISPMTLMLAKSAKINGSSSLEQLQKSTTPATPTVESVARA